MLALLLLALSSVAPGSLPPGFVREAIATGLDAPVDITFAGDRLLVGEKGGRILLIAPPAAPRTVLELAVDTEGERGLLAIQAGPTVATDGSLYVLYTTREPRNRVSRFTLAGESIDPASERVVWENLEQASPWHQGGDLHFGRDGMLYIATGERTAGDNAQQLSNHHGKILRLFPDGTAPPDNPFVARPGAQPAVWAYGLRNPFRFSIDPARGDLWIGDVGSNTSESWEEMNRGRSGANYGWPFQEGPHCLAGDCVGFEFPAFAYRRGDPAYSGDEPKATIIMGPVYRAAAYPPQYDGSIFFADYANRWIRRLRRDASDAPAAEQLFQESPDAGTVVDLEVGPDGDLYVVTFGRAWSGPPDEGAVHRIRYSLPVVRPLSPAARVGSTLRVRTANATPGSRLKVFIATATGAIDVVPDGLPLTPIGGDQLEAALPWPWPLPPPADRLLGHGYAALQLVRADGDLAVGEAAGTVLLGNPAHGVPSLRSLDGQPVNEASAHPSIAMAHVPAVLSRGGALSVGGDGFAAPVLNVFHSRGNCAPPGGLVPLEADAARMVVVLPDECPAGPVVLQVVNREGFQASNTLAALLDAPVRVADVRVTGEVVEVTGSGFGPGVAVNLFATSQVTGLVVNAGGLDDAGHARFPVEVVDTDHLRFPRPEGLAAGPAYVQVVAPPFAPFASSGTGSGGAFLLP